MRLTSFPMPGENPCWLNPANFICLPGHEPWFTGCHAIQTELDEEKGNLPGLLRKICVGLPSIGCGSVKTQERELCSIFASKNIHYEYDALSQGKGTAETQETNLDNLAGNSDLNHS